MTFRFLAEHQLGASHEEDGVITQEGLGENRQRTLDARRMGRRNG